MERMSEKLVNKRVCYSKLRRETMEAVFACDGLMDLKMRAVQGHCIWKIQLRNACKENSGGKL